MKKLFWMPLLCIAIGCGGDPAPTVDAGACELGAAGCACLEGAACAGDLLCNEGLCQASDRAALIVDDPEARSCEGVLLEDQTEVISAVFAAGVRGTLIRESPRSAITFHQTLDAPFEAGFASVRYTPGPGAALTLRRARCFDRQGDLLPGAPLRLEL
ncbi:MAG: hypothetical protein OEY14_00525 [Myxococcales bacterium]|nr:hypothetical protein [Myxococcales bacterium]